MNLKRRLDKLERLGPTEGSEVFRVLVSRHVWAPELSKFDLHAYTFAEWPHLRIRNELTKAYTIASKILLV